MKQAEKLLAKRLANYVRKTYPSSPFRFDLVDQIGLRNGIEHKELMGKWSKNYPDFFLPRVTKLYGGMYLELKDTPNGKVPNDAHTRGQALYHAVLREQGYYCEFCVGYDDCVSKIDWYMRLKRRKRKKK